MSDSNNVRSHAFNKPAPAEGYKNPATHGKDAKPVDHRTSGAASAKAKGMGFQEKGGTASTKKAKYSN